jgi:hypothetical protein
MLRQTFATRTPDGRTVKFLAPSSRELAFAQAMIAGNPGYTLEQTLLALSIEQIDQQGFPRSYRPEDTYRALDALSIKDISALTYIFSQKYLSASQKEVVDCLNSIVELNESSPNGSQPELAVALPARE